jgi:hypothetical protein
METIEMADLDKHSDRESWLTWAIEFIRRGLWLDQEITVHGPHDSTNVMWGKASARIDGQVWGPDCSFRAYANGSKYRPFRIRIWNGDDKDEQFLVLKASELTPKARKWLQVARRTLRKLRVE